MASFVVKGISVEEPKARVYEENVNFLNPEKDLKKEFGHNLFANEFSQKGSRQAVLKTMNALRVVSPVICALMSHPGLDANPKDISAAFKNMFTDISFIAEKMCEKLDVNPKEENNFWIKNVFEKNFADIVRSQWETNKSANIDDIALLFDDILAVADKMVETQVYEDISPLNNVRAAVLRCTIPILAEAINGYSLYRSVEDDIPVITETIFNASALATKRLADPYADSNSRAKLFYMLTTQATQVYLQAWREEGKSLDVLINKQPEDKIPVVIERCRASGGLPLAKVENNFHKQFERLVNITEILTLSGSRK